MKRFAAPLFCVALALLTFFEIPGHTWLQQDSQIYVPILEHERDPGMLRNDMLVQRSHVAYTLYDEIAVALRGATGLSFREVLAAEQIATRALGIWGLLMLAEVLGLGRWQAMVAAVVCSLGARITGPEVLTIEYEPTPRAFAVPLLVCAMGLAARGRWLASGIAAGAAVLYHAPTTLPVLAAGALVLASGRTDHKLRWSVPLACAFAILLVAAQGQEQHQQLFASLAPGQETLQRMRAAYVYVSTWPMQTIAWHLAIFAVLVAACRRLQRMGWLLLPAIGLLTMPLSWLLLEHWKWGLAPQIQPMRALLFGTLAMQLMTACAGMLAKRRGEAAVWLALAVAPSIPSLLAGYPQLHTPELGQLSAWARGNTSKDAVFVFPDSGKRLDAGIFRSEAQRAVYVDWKGGGQVNYLREFGDDWWFRWQQTVGRGFKAEDLGRYDGLGINYVVLRKRMADAPLFENGAYAVYAVTRPSRVAQQATQEGRVTRN
jgi:hypothetical protein